MLSISDTATEMVNWVFPEHAGAPGQIHGGRMMQWIATCGTIAASRVARGNVVLGAMDDIDFLHPVKVGQIAILRAGVEYVGTSSLEVGVRVFAEDVITGERRVTLNSHLVFVKVDEGVRPRSVEAKIRPRDAAESALVEAARARREQRLARFAQRQSRLSASAEPDLEAGDVDVGWRFESVRTVLPVVRRSTGCALTCLRITSRSRSLNLILRCSLRTGADAVERPEYGRTATIL